MLEIILTGLQIVSAVLLVILLWIISRAMGVAPIEGLKKIILRWFQK